MFNVGRSSFTTVFGGGKPLPSPYPTGENDILRTDPAGHFSGFSTCSALSLLCLTIYVFCWSCFPFEAKQTWLLHKNLQENASGYGLCGQKKAVSHEFLCNIEL